MMNYADYQHNVPWGTTSEDREAYRNAEAEMVDKFRKDIAAECGITGHPKEPLVWRLAWNYGYACGLSEVAYHYQDLAKLVK